LTVTFAPPAEAPAPPTSTLPCAIAYTWPSAPFNGVNSRVPPRKLLALPMEDTVTSIGCPGRAKAGKLAVTMTAATFFNCRRVVCSGVRLTPICDSCYRSPAW